MNPKKLYIQLAIPSQEQKRVIIDQGFWSDHNRGKDNNFQESYNIFEEHDPHIIART